MKILVVCDRYPWPLDNGQNLRIWHYVRALRGRHEFDLLCWGEPPVPPEVVALFGRVTVLPKPRHQDSGGRFARLRDSLDFRRIMATSGPTRAALAARAGDYELLWMSGWDTVTSFPPRLPCAWLADIVDEGTLEYSRALGQARGVVAKLRVAKRLAQVFAVERYYFGAADACVVVSDTDAQRLRLACRRTPVVSLPNGVDADFFAPQGLPAEPDTLVFEGRMDFPPNVDAACWFVREVLPRVRAQRPGAHLVLVGNKPVPEVLALAGEAVTVTGWVDDVRPHVDRAALFVAPMRLGAGIKNKVLQAWAMGKAVVATPAATGGLIAEPGVNIEVAEGAEALAAAIVALLANPARRAALGAAARATIAAHYTWARRAQDLEQAMELAVKRHRGTGDA